VSRRRRAGAAAATRGAAEHEPPHPAAADHQQSPRHLGHPDRGAHHAGLDAGAALRPGCPAADPHHGGPGARGGAGAGAPGPAPPQAGRADRAVPHHGGRRLGGHGRPGVQAQPRGRPRGAGRRHLRPQEDARRPGTQRRRRALAAALVPGAGASRGGQEQPDPPFRAPGARGQAGRDQGDRQLSPLRLVVHQPGRPAGGAQPLRRHRPGPEQRGRLGGVPDPAAPGAPARAAERRGGRRSSGRPDPPGRGRTGRAGPPAAQAAGRADEPAAGGLSGLRHHHADRSRARLRGVLRRPGGTGSPPDLGRHAGRRADGARGGRQGRRSGVRPAVPHPEQATPAAPGARAGPARQGWRLPLPAGVPRPARAAAALRQDPLRAGRLRLPPSPARLLLHQRRGWGGVCRRGARRGEPRRGAERRVPGTPRPCLPREARRHGAPSSRRACS